MSGDQLKSPFESEREAEPSPAETKLELADVASKLPPSSSDASDDNEDLPLLK